MKNEMERRSSEEKAMDIQSVRGRQRGKVLRQRTIPFKVAPAMPCEPHLKTWLPSSDKPQRY